MEQHRPDIQHFIDAWRVAKGLKKKLVAASRLRGCNVIDKWVTSIIKHFYFCVRTAAARAATLEKRGELAVAIWLCFLNHVQKKRCGHNEEYANCEHWDLLPRKWIFSGRFGISLDLWTSLWKMAVLDWRCQLCLCHHHHLQALLQPWTSLY
ncbi:hypothetical protein HPB51_001441 [Rhipicephalus microplus]|uniref:Uncharacterized protein n=1 Tax=Rhipicephalus microplus TaxID=6941 RepID=A0A9J6EEK6_RHIMP|nr:hypothetical protein HPB51_001441 [Rhipicephalus microplus]